MEASSSTTSKRVVRVLSAVYFDPAVDPLTGGDVRTVRSAARGQEIELVPSEEKRLDDLNALAPKGATAEDVDQERDAILDLYRGQRGDVEAMQRAVQRAGSEANLSDTTGGIVDVTLGGGVAEKTPEDRGNVGQIADHISGSKLSAEDTVALAGDDKQQAKRVLEAERLASGGQPRKPVEEKLKKIIDG